MQKRESEWNLQLTAWREDHARQVAAEMGLQIEFDDVEVLARNQSGMMEVKHTSGLKAVRLSGMADDFQSWDKQREEFYERLDEKAGIIPKQRQPVVFPFTVREL